MKEWKQALSPQLCAPSVPLSTHRNQPIPCIVAWSRDEDDGKEKKTTEREELGRLLASFPARQNKNLKLNKAPAPPQFNENTYSKRWCCNYSFPTRRLFPTASSSILPCFPTTIHNQEDEKEKEKTTSWIALSLATQCNYENPRTKLQPWSCWTSFSKYKNHTENTQRSGTIAQSERKGKPIIAPPLSLSRGEPPQNSRSQVATKQKKRTPKK